MKQTNIKKTLIVAAMLLFLCNPCICFGQYLLDTFEDDGAGNPPNGPEIGSALYGGSATHKVINYSGDLRLLSSDSDPSGSILITYVPFSSADIVEVRYQVLIESGGTLVGQNAFNQEMVLEPGGTNIKMSWSNVQDWVFTITRPGSSTTIYTGLTWVLDTYYIINVHIDTVNDTFRVEMFDGMTTILGTTAIGYNATGFNHMSFSSNYNTLGNQRINDVLIRRDCAGSPCTWYVDTDAAGDNSGESWGDAFVRLQDALTVAQGGDEVWVAEGTYYPDDGVVQSDNDRSESFVLLSDVSIYGGFDGSESNVAERDWMAHETILSGEIGGGGTSDNSYHVVLGSSSDGTAILDGFTISDGYSVGEGYPDYVGAGMLIMSTGEPTVSNCLFTNNNSGAGGGLGAWGTGSPSLFSCIFLANTSNGSGGAVSIQTSSPVFRSCMFMGNSTPSNGGAIKTLNSLAAPVLTNCVFSGNTASGNGGAISSSKTVTHYPPELTNCSINENSAGNNGGGIHNSGGVDVTLNSCILWGNSDPGGVDESAQYYASGTPSIVYSCLQGWTGGWGGAGNIGANPLFVDPDGIDDVLGNIDDNLRLQLASPSIDTGDPDPSLNDSDGSRNDMGAYGGPASDLGGIGVFPGSGYIFTSVGNIPRSEITQTTGDVNAPVGLANGGPMTSYQNAALGRSLHLHGLFGDLDVDVDFYQVLAGAWDGMTPPNPLDPADWKTLHGTLKKVLYTYNVGLGEWEDDTITLGPQVIDGVPDLYQLTSTGFWSFIDKRIIWNTRDESDGLYTLTVKAYNEVSPGVLNDITALLGNIGTIVLEVNNSPVSADIHHVNYDPGNPYYVLADDGEIKECSIINLSGSGENLRFFITASHSDGYLRKFTLDNIWGKNQYGGVIAQEVYSVPPAMWNGVTNLEYESQFAPNPPGNLVPWKRCAYQFRLRVWPRITNGYGYFGHSGFSDHYFLDLPGSLDCSVYDSDNDGFIDNVDLAAFANFWLGSCVVE